jgi:hypothetical protein
MSTLSDPNGMALYYDYMADVKDELWPGNDYASWLENRVANLEATIKKLQEQVDGNADAQPVG